MGIVNTKTCPVCGHTDLQQVYRVKDHSISKEEFDLIQCGSCKLTITQDHPDIESIGPYYVSEDYISHSNTSKGLVNSLYHGVRKYMLGQKKKLVEKYGEKGTILDIGAGTGFFLSHMRDSGWDVIGLEPDDGARKVAKEECNIELQTIDNLYKILKGSVDVVTMWHVLEHVHNLNEDVQQINDLLREKGILVIAVPNPTSSDAGHYRKFWAGYDVPRHLWHFSPESMKHLLEKHGFNLLTTKGMPFDAFYVSLLSEKYKGGALGLFNGGIAGTMTNLKSLGNTHLASSLIYVAQKK